MRTCHYLPSTSSSEGSQVLPRHHIPHFRPPVPSPISWLARTTFGVARDKLRVRMQIDFEECARRWIRGRMCEQLHAQMSARVYGFENCSRRLKINFWKRDYTCDEERRRGGQSKIEIFSAGCLKLL